MPAGKTAGATFRRLPLCTAATQTGCVIGATWLQVNDLTTAGRPVASESLGAAWGYHVDDINLALGNLVDDVTAEEAAYTSQH